MHSAPDRESEVFLQALGIKDETKRRQFLEDACRDTPMLRSRVELLLAAAHSADEDFLEPDSDATLAAERNSLVRELSQKDRFLHELGTRIHHIGDYTLLEELGRGSMGVVFRARQDSLQREVAVKVILGSSISTPEGRQRFRIEAESAALLSHPHIVPIYEIGNQEEYDFYSMELITGGTLGERMPSGPMPPREAVTLMIKVASAVQAAHRSGILHRDLKPDNILLDEEGEPHISDFGLACRLEQLSNLTLSGQIMGTPQYMAPEQAAQGDGPATVAVDVYSLGAILYALLSGDPPFRGESLLGTLEQVKTQPPPPLCPRVPGLDRDLETITLKCLEKNPAARYGSAEALRRDLEAWLDRRPIAARAPGTLERARKWIHRRPVHAALLGTAVLLLLTLGLGGPLAALQQSRLRKQADHHRAQAETNERKAREQAIRNRNLAYASHMRLLALAHESGKNVGLAPETMIASWATPLAGEDLRGWEWYYNYGKIHFEPARFSVGAPVVHALDFSPMGNLIVCASPHQTVIRNTFTTVTYRVLRDKETHLDARWSPDGTRLLTLGTSGTVTCWDPYHGEALGTLATAAPGRSLTWGPDSRSLAVLGRDGSLQVWTFDREFTSLRLAEETKASPQLTHVAWSPDGAHLAAVGGSTDVFLWRLGELAQAPLRRQGHNTTVTTLAWQPNGHWLATGSEKGTVRIWSLPAGERVATLSHYFATPVRSLSWNADGTVVAASLEGLQAISLLDLAESRRDSIRGFPHPLTQVAWNGHAHSLAMADKTGGVHIHRRGLPKPSLELGRHQSGLRTLRWDQSGEEINALDRHGLLTRHRVSDPGNPLNSFFPFPGETLLQASWSPTGQQLAALLSKKEGPQLNLFDLRTSRPARPLNTGPAIPRALFWLERGQLLFAGDKGRVGHLDLRRPRPSRSPSFLPRPPQAGKRDYTAVSASPDHRWVLATGEGAFLTLWSRDENRIVLDTRAPGTSSRVRVHAWHPRGTHFALADSYGEVTIWSVADRAPLRRFSAQRGPVSALAWHPGGERLAIGGREGNVRLWDWRDGELMLELEAHERAVRSLAWEPQGRRLASACEDGKLHLWDATAGILLSGELME